MVAIPDVPGERNRAGRARSLPAVPVHHRQPFAKDMDACQAAILENGTAPLGAHEGKAQEHDHARTERERVGYELVGELIGWVGDDGADRTGEEGARSIRKSTPLEESGQP
jgi:hypothetical protein